MTGKVRIRLGETMVLRPGVLLGVENGQARVQIDDYVLTTDEQNLETYEEQSNAVRNRSEEKRDAELRVLRAAAAVIGGEEFCRRSHDRSDYMELRNAVAAWFAKRSLCDR